MSLVHFYHLADCDRYFEMLLAGSNDRAVLGNIELEPGELEHLTKLIATGLEKPDHNLHGSLSLAVFLVQMGIFHYRDNYWAPVYSSLGLPADQVKWQRVLGEAFLAAVAKYKLVEFADGSRYIMPILAQGYIPNAYLESYFRDVVLAIYKERENAGMPVIQAEIEHLVENWRKDYYAHHKLENMLEVLINSERYMSLALQMWEDKNKLKRLQCLQARNIETKELKELLAFPEGWLEQAENRREYLQEQIRLYFNQRKQLKEITDAIKKGYVEIDTLNVSIEDVGDLVLGYWDDSLADKLEGLPVNEIAILAQEYAEVSQVFFGRGHLLGRLLRLLLRRRYRQAIQHQKMLEEKLNGVSVKGDFMVNPWPSLPENLLKLQQLLKQRHEAEKGLQELHKAEQRITLASPADLDLWQEQLTELDKRIAKYKMQLVTLGKGRLADGMQLLTEQKAISEEIKSIIEELGSSDIVSFLAVLPWMEKYTDEKFLRDDLIEIRKQKNDISQQLRAIKEPLYFLNESTRIFILQGGKLAEKFLFDSLLFMQRLDKDERPANGTIMLPLRISLAMEKWWQQQGRSMLAEERRSQGRVSERNIFLHRPIIKLDTVGGTLKVELPQQKVITKERATFGLRGGSDASVFKVDVAVKEAADRQYRTEKITINLEQPLPVYEFTFRCGEISHSWWINGIDGDNTCLLFSLRGELIEDGRLPDDCVYLVAPAGSILTPTRAIKEQEGLTGSWFNYEYWYLELDAIEAILVKTETNVMVFKKRPERLEPRLLGGDELVELKTAEGPLYRGQLPGLIFSKDDAAELRLYGIRLDCSGVSKYFSLEFPEIIVSKDNSVYVPLSAFFSDIYGVCAISLLYRSSIVWQQKCVVVPNLELEFDQAIYTPATVTGIIELSSDVNFIFIVQPPALVCESSPTRVLIQFDTCCEQISGQLGFCIDQGPCFQVGVWIDIPAVRWRKSADDPWQIEVGEIWHENLGEIQALLPHGVTGPVKLALDNGKQVISRQARERMVVFNLSQFSDTLRSDNLPIYNVTLSIREKDMQPFLLLRIRMRWQVSDITLEQRRDNDKRTITLIWKDLGTVSDRIVRLWPLDLPGVNMLERRIPDGVSSVEITELCYKLPAGGYRLQFIIDDPWDEIEVTLPAPASENCLDVTIGDKEEILQDIMRNGLIIESFICGDENIPAGKVYWLHDIIIKPEFVGEERFQGNVYTTDQEGNSVALDYNPVSFYLDLDRGKLGRLPFLIDRDKDGATYCKRCRVLFWEIAHRECGRQGDVILPEYISIKLRRDNNGPGTVTSN